MQCRKCGFEMKSDADFCPGCGAKVLIEKSNSTQEELVDRKSLAAMTYEYPTLIAGAFAIVFGLISFFVFAWFFFLSLASGFIGFFFAKADDRRSGSFSKPGKVMSIIGIAFGSLILCLWLFSLLWGLLSGVHNWDVRGPITF